MRSKLVAGGAVAVMVAGGLVLALVSRRPPADPAAQRLLGARYFEPRLSTTDSWSPCAPRERRGLGPVYCTPPPPPSSLPRSPEVFRGRGWTRLADREGAEAAADPALLALVAEGSQGVERAIALLRERVEERPEEAAAWTDLSAALAVRAQRTGEPADLVRALGSAGQAARLAPADPRAAFNLALILDELHLVDSAAVAWWHYLRLDSRSPWAAEARLRLDALLASPALAAPAGPPSTTARDAQGLRSELEGELAAWATASLAGSAEADPLLDDVVAAARRLAAMGGDELLASGAEVLRRRRDGGDLEALRRLAAGHVAYAAAAALLRARRHPEAESLARQAREHLASGGSPFALWADLVLLRCAYARADTARLREIGEAMTAATAGVEASAIRARARWVTGSALLAQGLLGEAAASLQLAAEEFRRLGEVPNTVAVEGLLASSRHWTGRSAEAWRLWHGALEELRRWPDARRRGLLAVEMAYAAAEMGEPLAARGFQDEAVRVAAGTGDEMALISGLQSRADGAVAIGDDPRPDLALARWLLPLVEDEEARADYEVRQELVAGKAVRHRAPEEARRRLRAAEAAAERRGLTWDLPEIHLERARAEAALGEEAAAREHLLRSLDQLDAQRETLLAYQERIALTDRRDEVLDELIGLEIQAGDPEAAWAAAEAGRARSLREHRGPAAGNEPPPTQAAVRRALGPDEALLYYRLLADRVVIWCLTREAAVVRVVEADRHAVRRRVEEARHAIDAGLPAEDHLARLWELVIGPVAADLEGHTRFVVAPHDALFEVPFAALRDAAAGRYLAERGSISVAPTAALWLELRRRGTSGAPPQRLLAVADPAFDRGAFPRLERLSGAVAEARGVAGLYPDAELLLDDEATVEALLEGLADHQVLHYAGHSVSHPRDPFESTVLLAPGVGDDGTLTVARLLGEEVGEVPELVVLASCDSATAAVSRSEGSLGFAWAFLAAGARWVVASGWDLEDDAGDLLIDFHKGVARGEGAAESLHRVQVERLRRGLPVRDWAALTLFGG
jgi:CHAT domain-containing protein